MFLVVSTGAEPFPYIPSDVIKKAVKDGPKMSRDIFVKMAGANATYIPPTELLSLPVCMQFATTLGGRSFIGRRMVAPKSSVMKIFGGQSHNRRHPSRQRKTSDTVLDQVDNTGTAESRRQQFARTRRLESSDF